MQSELLKNRPEINYKLQFTAVRTSDPTRDSRFSFTLQVTVTISFIALSCSSKWDFRFLRRWAWRWLSSGMLLLVVWYKFTDMSEASICEKYVNVYQITKRSIQKTVIFCSWTLPAYYHGSMSGIVNFVRVTYFNNSKNFLHIFHFFFFVSLHATVVKVTPYPACSVAVNQSCLMAYPIENPRLAELVCS
jgi:hypothetical protein